MTTEKVRDPNKKKVCKLCGRNDYVEKYSQHLKRIHADIASKRTFIKNFSNHLNAEELEQVSKLMLELEKTREAK